jgi:hypothetical protein
MGWLAEIGPSWYNLNMSGSMDVSLPEDLASELEQKYFWWEPVSSHPRSNARILAQAMELAPFTDIRRIERVVGPQKLAAFMRHAEPGWFSERSWEFWRGRLSVATGQPIPDQPPRRSLHARAV